MINKLKKKFLLLATISMSALMCVLVGVMNAINYSVVVRESDATIDLLFHTNAPAPDKDIPPAADDIGSGQKPPSGLSPEVPYEARFFTVTVSPDGNIIKTDFSKILTVDDTTVSDYVNKALDNKNEKGFIEQFRYAKRTVGQETTVLFLDCGRKLDSFRSVLLTSVLVGLSGCVIVFVAFLFLSGKIVEPIAESYEKQKRFVSDAGHEMKTPLTIINANLDLIDVEEESYGEEFGEIRSQVKRLSKLTNELVYLSKMEESEHKLIKIEMPLSDAVSEAVSPFRVTAAAKKIELNTEIQPDVTACASPDSIVQLVSILTENAVKYSPEGGTVTVSLSTNKKTANLSVFNTTFTEIKKEELQHVFDRFYRSDDSRNSETGGHGIGLSIAKAIAEAHGGNIKAETKSGKDFCVSVNLPLE